MHNSFILFTWQLVELFVFWTTKIYMPFINICMEILTQNNKIFFVNFFRYKYIKKCLQIYYNVFFFLKHFDKGQVDFAIHHQFKGDN